jgi:hypothetical protein
VAAPGGGEPELQRQPRVRVVGDVGDREVVGGKGGGEAAEREEDEQELRARRGPADRDPARVAPCGAGERQQPLHRGDEQREDQREVAELRRHGFTVRAALCAWSIACFASGGM